MLIACTAALLLPMMLAVYAGLPGADWLLGVPLNLVPALGVCALLWASAYGLGDPAARWLLPSDSHTPAPTRRLLQAALGMASLLLLWWVLFWLVGVNRFTTALPVVAGLVLLVYRAVKAKDDLKSIDLAKLAWPWALPALMPGVALLLVAAACPPGTLWRVEAMGYDVTSYHLQIPSEWIAIGRATPLDHNVYSFFPGLMEHAYAAIGTLFGGSMRDAVYGCQVFHASFALLAAWGLIESAKRLGSGPAAIVAAGAVLLVPWVIITGSLAYNEAAVLGFGAAALCLALQPGVLGWRRGMVIGVLLGSATLCKLTAGPMVAVPVAVLALLPDLLSHRSDSVRSPVKSRLLLGGTLAAAMLLTLAPYFARNAIATGNPVFPFATAAFGTGHWDAALAERWHNAHTLGADRPTTFDALHRQWLGNAGYGALGGSAVPPESRNIARFTHERGLPVFWLAALTAFALMLGHPRTWRLALAMLSVLVWQLVFWRVGTHLQSRFLLFTLLPASVVLAVGAGRIRDVAGSLRGVLPPIASAVLLLSLLTVALGTLWHQTPPVQLDDGSVVPGPVYLSIDALADPGNPEQLGRPGTHPINLLPPDTKTLVIADNSALLYLDRPIIYSSAFDINPLGEMVRATDGSVAAINAALRDAGVTHVWISGSEVARLRATYGFDASLTTDLLQALVASWWPAMDPRLQAPLFRIPPAGLEAGHAGYNRGHTSPPPG